MAGTTINNEDLVFLADKNTKYMKEIEVSDLIVEVDEEIGLQRITNTEIEEMLT